MRLGARCRASRTVARPSLVLLLLPSFFRSFVRLPHDDDDDDDDPRPIIGEFNRRRRRHRRQLITT